MGCLRVARNVQDYLNAAMFLRELYPRALNDDPHLRNGLNVHAGRITYRAVAEALKQDYTMLSCAADLMRSNSIRIDLGSK